MRSILVLRISIVLALTLVSGTSARAQYGSQVSYLDPSIRASGMGNAGAAVFWGTDPDVWANPALAAFYDGVVYSGGKTQLLPELTDDIHFTSHSGTFGMWGVGVSLAGKPFQKVGGSRIDYGESERTDVNGNVIGTFRSHEDMRTVALGIELLEIVERSLERFQGSHSRFRDRFSLAVGHAWKTVEGEVGGTPMGGGWYGRGRLKDRGILARFSPWASLPGEEDLRSPRSETRSRIDFSFAYAELNYDGDSEDIGFINDERVSAAGRMMIGFENAAGGRSVIRDFFAPTLSLGMTYERTGELSSGSGKPIQRVGGELTVAEVFSLRLGHVDDDTGQVRGLSWGVGVSLNYRGLAGVRWDHASVPQADPLDDSQRNGFVVFVKPAAFKAWR